MAKKRADGRAMKSRTVDGKRIYGYGRTQREAQDDLDRKVAEYKKNGGKKGRDLTLDEYYAEWTEARVDTVKPTSIIKQQVQYRLISAFQTGKNGKTLGSLKLPDIEPRHVTALQKWLAEGHSTSYTNSCVSHLKHVLETAVEQRILEWNPCNGTKGLKRTEKPARETIHRALTKEETTAFFEAAKDSWYYNLFRFMISTGMRLGEAGALCLSDIDTKKGIIHVRRTITKGEGGNGIIGNDAKTSAGKRDIPLTANAKAAIESQRRVNAIVSEGKVIPIGKPIFQSPKGNLLHPSVVTIYIKNICSKAGIEAFGTHAFRDTFATRAIESGMNPKTLQTILGHSTMAMTMDLYVHVMEDTKATEMEAVAVGI